MAFAILLLKARKINKRKQRLDTEKRHAIKLQEGEKPKYSLAEKYRYFIIDQKMKIKNFFNRIFSFPKNSLLHRISVNMRHDGTLENFLLKSVIGFMGGFFLIYVFFMFFVIILNFSLGVATLLCAIFGCILTVGLAFDKTVRQITFLILPQFFSQRGRQALLAYAFILAVTGPCRNTLNNMGIMSESLACGQEQLKQAVKQIIDLIKKPFIAIKEAIKKIIVIVKDIVKKIKEIFLTIKRIVMGIVKVIKSAFNFLGKIFNICSKKVGTPFERCTKVFDNSVIDCYAKLGPMFDWLCAIAYVTKYVCYIVKPLDFICMLLDFISNSVIGVIVKKIKAFVRHVRSTFYVRIRFSHSFKFETVASKSMKEATEGMVNEIKERTKKLSDVFNFASALTSFFFFIIILKAIIYRHKFMTNERFENRYITNDFREIDFRRAKMEKETILPLNHREKSKYVNVTSLRLVKKEKKQLFKNVAILTMATFKLGIHIFTDYSLWWMLDKIRFYGKYANTVQVPQTVGLNVNGKGFIANLFRSVIKAFNPLGKTMNIDTVPCLPDPIPPDIDKYIQIGFILFLCWFLAFLEPYGLRLRIYVLNHYHPTRARERAVWLYNHVLRNRTSFLKFARRALKRKFFGQKDSKETKITCKEFFRAKISHGFLRFCLKPCLGDDRQEACVLCAQVFRPDEEKRPIRCATPGCVGLYCEPCFNDLENICTICQDPIQYGDLSDIDEEKDSSEDENSAKYKRRLKSKEENKLEQKNGENDKEDTELKSRKTAGEDFLIFSSSSSSTSTEFSVSDNSTEYSYSYQYNKSYQDLQTSFRTPFIDVEQQKIPDYVSMDTFQDYLFQEEEQSSIIEEEKSIKKIFPHDSSEEEKFIERKLLLNRRKRKSSREIKEELFGSISSSETDSDDDSKVSQLNDYQKYYRKANKRKVKKWLEGKTMFGAKRSPREELIPLLNLQHSHEESEKESACSDQPKTTIYSKTSSTESIKSKQNYQPISNNQTPNEELPNMNKYSSVNETNTVTCSEDISSKLNYLFPNVRYEEVNENPITSSDCSYLINTSRTSSSDTKLIHRRKTFIPSTNTFRENRSDDYLHVFSLKNSEENSQNYREKIRNYYQSISRQTSCEVSTPDKKNKITSFLSRLF